MVDAPLAALSKIQSKLPIFKVLDRTNAATAISSVSRGNATKTGASQTLNAWGFWLLAILSLALAQVPGISWLFTPINQFTTMVHELSHALVCIATGGWVSGMTIVGDAAGHGGLTFTNGGMPFLITQAGYLGTAVFGCFLIFLGQFTRLSKYILVVLGTAVGLASLFLVGANLLSTGLAGLASLLWGLAMSAFLIWAGVKWNSASANLLLLFLAIQTALNSVVCIYYLIQIYFGFAPAGGSWSDATNMAQMTGIPAFFWSIFWFLCSVALVAFTLWHTYGKRLFAKQLPLKK